MGTSWLGRCAMKRRSRRLAATLAAALLLGGVQGAGADDASDAAALVDRARATIESWEMPPGYHPFVDLARNAKAILVIPKYTRAAFIFGGQGGSGVILSREPMNRELFGPAFVSLGGGSFGFQAGMDTAELIVLVMTDQGLADMIDPGAKFGVDLSATGGPAGAGIRGETPGISADIITLWRSKGLYGGVSVEGGTIRAREGLNTAYYGKAVTPTDILIRASASNPHADPLKMAIVKLGGGR